jgi:hypothetical protein
VTERWAPIEGFEGRYEVSDQGRVRNVTSGRLLKGPPNSRGYCHVGLARLPVKPKIMKVHRLVALAFLPNPEGLAEVNHKDLDRRHNAVTNLEWSSKQANCEHAQKAASYDPMLHPRRIKKLQPADVLLIHELRAAGARCADLGAEFGVTESQIARVVNGSSYPTAYNQFHNLEPGDPGYALGRDQGWAKYVHNASDGKDSGQ